MKTKIELEEAENGIIFGLNGTKYVLLPKDSAEVRLTTIIGDKTTYELILRPVK
jgi:hypothetical protein